MKRNWKSLMVSGTVLTVLAGALTLPAMASVGQRTAALHYQNIKVTLDGRTLDLTDSRGNEVEPFTIDGTTVKSIGATSIKSRVADGFTALTLIEVDKDNSDIAVLYMAKP